MTVAVKVTVNNTVTKLLGSLSEAFDPRKVLEEAGALLLDRIRARFLREVDPDEEPWPPSEAAIKRRKQGGTGTLFDTGDLFRSIQLTEVVGDSEYAEMQIFSDTPYGIFHQQGTSILPVRRFMGVSDADSQLVEKLINKRIKEAVNAL
jgi:phage gpG-like protein